MSQLSGIYSGSKDSNRSQVDSKEEPRKISFCLPEKSYVWTGFSFFFFFESRVSKWGKKKPMRSLRKSSP